MINRPLTLCRVVSVLLLIMSLFSVPATAIPLCSGPTSVVELGTQGCTIDNLTFSDFSFSGATGTPFSPIAMDPADILIDIFASTLAINILEREPAIALQVTPRSSAVWTTGGLFSSVNLVLNYVVTAAAATFDRYQVTGTGIGGSLRGGRFGASMSVDAGSQTVGTGSFGPFLQIGEVTPNTSAIAVRTTGGASQGVAPGGATFISSITNIFTTRAAPVSTTGTLSLGLLALCLMRVIRTGTQ